LGCVYSPNIATARVPSREALILQEKQAIS